MSQHKKGKGSLTRHIFRGVIILSAGLAVVGLYSSWKAAWWPQLTALISEHPEYVLSPGDLDLPEGPPWLRRNIPLDLWEVMKQRGVTNTLQPGISELIFRIAGDHPWINRVHFVRAIFPRSVEIRLEYRRPVCLVAGTSFAIDAQGVTLPAADLREGNLLLYVLVGVQPTSAVLLGRSWPDGRVIEAGRIAEFLGPIPVEKGFAYIVPRVTFRPLEPDDIVFSLRDGQGRELFWGRAPGREAPGEPPASTKRERLLGQLQTFHEIPLHRTVDLTLAGNALGR